MPCRLKCQAHEDQTEHAFSFNFQVQLQSSLFPFLFNLLLHACADRGEPVSHTTQTSSPQGSDQLKASALGPPPHASTEQQQQLQEDPDLGLNFTPRCDATRRRKKLALPSFVSDFHFHSQLRLDPDLLLPSSFSLSSSLLRSGWLLLLLAKFALERKMDTTPTIQENVETYEQVHFWGGSILHWEYLFS
ncbi:uncharacterized protein LOC129309862 isoform X2 [Prosopis cineraria]|uniref:uncharacterized protein LOC129309862 isoform X2 n=1 Tax=Prosopis cineraria TaxID=364024 RepID=UPI002410551A|nr:uncharacterized protein LOC129309862 isoform X2 [Prosopis cineraria]